MRGGGSPQQCAAEHAATVHTDLISALLNDRCADVVDSDFYAFGTQLIARFKIALSGGDNVSGGLTDLVGDIFLWRCQPLQQYGHVVGTSGS